jgi:hypothetical protein
MASVMITLEKLRWMDWLDAVMLNVVATEAPNEQLPPRSLPKLVLIDAQAYADYFRARSPLDRDTLGRVIDELLSTRPSALMVDLQLEPGPDEVLPRPLDGLLAAAAQPQGERAAVRITLPLPVLRTPAVDARSMQWMRQLCAAGVHFGSAELRSHFGSVVRLDQDPLALAQVARAPSREESHGEHHRHGDSAPASLCSLARQGATLEVTWSMLRSTADHRRSAPLAPVLVKHLDATQLPWRPGQTAAQLTAGANVVLGGAYDSQDRFVTSALPESVPGALVHASALANPGRDGHHAWAWLTDVVLGTALGFLFHALWRWVGSYAMPEDWSGRDLARACLVPCKALAPWAVAAAISYVLMLAAGWLMTNAMWLNPGPMVLGMMLHTLLLKEEAAEEDETEPAKESEVKVADKGKLDQPPATASTHGHAITSWRDYTRHHPTWPLQVVLILAGLAFGLSGHH